MCLHAVSTPKFNSYMLDLDILPVIKLLQIKHAPLAAQRLIHLSFSSIGVSEPKRSWTELLKLCIVAYQPQGGAMGLQVH